MLSTLDKLNRNNGAEFFPAISTATFTYIVNQTDDEIINRSENIKKSFRFFNSDDKQYFNHPFVLISAVHLYLKDKSGKGIRNVVGIDDDAMVFVDSGGYSLSSGAISEEKWNNEIALEYSLNGGDVFPILDRPLIPNCSYDKNLKLSRGSAEYYKANRNDDGKKIILNVVQGRTGYELDKWIDNMAEVELDGWAHGGHKGNISNITSTILKLYNLGLMNKSKQHHIFGVSSCAAMIYFAVIQDELRRLGVDTKITYDSSYFQRSWGFGNFFLYKKFDGMVNIKFSNRFDWSNLPETAKMPCECEICSNVTDMKNFIDDSGTFYLIGTFHNLKQMLSYKTSIENLLHFDMNDLLKDALPAKMFKNIQAIREAFKDPKNGEEIIRRKFDDRGLDSGDGTTLEDFFV